MARDYSIGRHFATAIGTPKRRISVEHNEP
jgi:hypothetical protein